MILRQTIWTSIIITREEYLNLQVQLCNTDIFMTGIINMGIGLYDKAPDQIKLKKSFNSFEKDLKIFLFKHCFCLLMNLSPFNFQVCGCIIIFII
jgi:hypothetical protein